MAQASVATKGLEGITATTSGISSIIGSTLTYRGYDILELAENSTFEEVVYLLWFGELPSRQQLKDLKQSLAKNREVSSQIIQAIRDFPKDANTMVALRTAVSALAFYDPLAEDMSVDATKQTAIRLVAKMSTIVAALERIRNGQDPIAPDPNLNEATNFLYMLNGKRPSELEAHTMDVALILHADHELNASTFAARVAASTLADMTSAVVAALCTLKGPLHGGANEQVMKMLETIGVPEKAAKHVQDALERKERIMGFGHRVYKEGDPRARILKKLSQQLGQETGNASWYEISNTVEQEVKADKGLLPNVDFYSASVYTYLGIPRDLFTPIFAMSRVAGWTAHILEQFADNRLIRPRAEYTGPEYRHYVPVEKR